MLPSSLGVSHVTRNWTPTCVLIICNRRHQDRVIGTMKDNKGSPHMSGEEGAECVRNVSVSDPGDPLIQQTFPVLSAPKLLTP